MNTKKKIMMILTGERPLKDVWYYIQGNIRFWFYYDLYKTKFPFLSFLKKIVLPKYIKEQIDFRIKVMNTECYNQGSCVICGCETTKLQMANKSCDGYCYPKMMSKVKWGSAKNIVYDYYKPKNNV